MVLSPDEQAAAVEKARRECAEQGIEFEVTDPGRLDRIARAAAPVLEQAS